MKVYLIGMINKDKSIINKVEAPDHNSAIEIFNNINQVNVGSISEFDSDHETHFTCGDFHGFITECFEEEDLMVLDYADAHMYAIEVGDLSSIFEDYFYTDNIKDLLPYGRFLLDFGRYGEAYYKYKNMDMGLISIKNVERV